MPKFDDIGKRIPKPKAVSPSEYLTCKDIENFLLYLI